MTAEKSIDVRATLVDALQLDLIGPTGPLGNHNEVLSQSPLRWFLTGLLVPTDADKNQRIAPTASDELDQEAEPAGVNDDETRFALRGLEVGARSSSRRSRLQVHRRRCVTVHALST